MNYILGVITGILLSAFLILIDLYLHKKVARGGLQEILTKATAEKGEIHIPPTDTQQHWLDTLKKNDEAGIDTLLSDL
jgi:hypothetical protein